MLSGFGGFGTCQSWMMGVSGLWSGYPLDHEDPSEDCLSNFIEFVDWIRRFRFWACRVAGMCLCRIRAAMRAGFGFRLQHQSSNHFHDTFIVTRKAFILLPQRSP